MLVPDHRRLKLRLLDALWVAERPLSAREAHDGLDEDERPKINTTRATLERLVHEGYVRRVGQVGHSALFEAAISRAAFLDNEIDHFAELLGGDMSAVLFRLVQTGWLGSADLQAVETLLRQQQRNNTGPGRRR